MSETELDLNLETCIRCTELSYRVADGLGDELRAELAALRAVARAAWHMARTLPVSRVWTSEEVELAATSAALTRLVGDPPEVAAAGPIGAGTAAGVVPSPA